MISLKNKIASLLFSFLITFFAFNALALTKGSKIRISAEPVDYQISNSFIEEDRYLVKFHGFYVSVFDTNTLTRIFHQAIPTPSVQGGNVSQIRRIDDWTYSYVYLLGYTCMDCRGAVSTNAEIISLEKTPDNTQLSGYGIKFHYDTEFAAAKYFAKRGLDKISDYITIENGQVLFGGYKVGLGTIDRSCQSSDYAVMNYQGGILNINTGEYLDLYWEMKSAHPPTNQFLAAEIKCRQKIKKYGKQKQLDAKTKVKHKMLNSLKFHFYNSEYLILKGPYFTGTSGVSSNISVSNGLSLLSLQDIAGVFNRPDKILEQIEAPATWVEAFRQLSIEENLFVANNALFTSPKITLTQNKLGKVTYHVQHNGISSALVKVNGVVVTSLIEVDDDSGIIVSFDIAPGRNQIEIIPKGEEIINAVAAYDEVFSEEKEGNFYFLGIGVSDYSNNSFDLKYPVKDIVDISKLPIFNDSLLLKDREVTSQGLEVAKSFLKNIGPKDKVLVLMSGHGAYSENLGEFTFFSSNSSPNNYEITGIPFSRVNELLENVNTSHITVVVDSCESGKRGYQFESNSSLPDTFNAKAISLSFDLNSFENKTKRFSRFIDPDMFIFSRLRKPLNARVLAGSSGSQVAYEDSKLSSGILSYFLREKLTSTGRYPNKDDLRDISRAVNKYTDGLQTPFVYH